MGGAISGILAGILGIGGGVLLNPLLVGVGTTPVQAAATSSLAILMTATAGTFQNWRMGFLQIEKTLYLGIPAILTAQLGVLLGSNAPDYLLALGFGLLLIINIYLVGLKKKAITKAQSLTGDPEAQVDSLPAVTPPQSFWRTPLVARLTTGGLAGLLAGLFGVGGGVVMVPMQILLLNEPIKDAVRTSLSVIVITGISACVGHALRGNVLVLYGLVLGLAGMIGAQAGTRFLPKLSDRTISIAFRLLMAVLSTYMFWKAWALVNS
ncbi:MAG: sulfite exporter TauE/SafE family protein [Synechococcaceae cyanobacterium SM2_3_2]|nr:sulfite exporter TauE/SafE family protein [Synechococcaceae cyanobacterium SM2_3_2]